MHRKFDVRRIVTAFFVGIFTVLGSIVAIDAPANAANDPGYNATVDSTLNFNAASSQYASTSATVLPGTGNFTAEAWFNETSGTTALAMILSQGVFNVASARFAVGLEGTADSRNLKVWMKDANGLSLTTANSVLNSVRVLQGAWHHLALTFTSGTGYSVYLDGYLIATVSNTGTSNISGSFL